GLRYAPQSIPWLVGLVITAAYWFTSSTSFANPAVTLARGFTATFAGIAINHVPGFIAAQVVGAAIAAQVANILLPAESSPAAPSIAASAPDRPTDASVTHVLEVDQTAAQYFDNH